MSNQTVRYLKKIFDETTILYCLVDLAFTPKFEFTKENQAILSALQRSSKYFKQLSVEEIKCMLIDYDGNQIEKLVSRVKEVTHDMEFIKIENKGGAAIYASLYPDTNNSGYDVQLFDEETKEHWTVQLADDKSYVGYWIEKHPDGEILIANELAEKIGIEGSDIETSQVTMQVEDFVDKLIAHNEVEALASSFPLLALASVAIIIWELWKRYEAGQLSYSRFKLLVSTTAGKKTIKISTLVVLLSIPVVNVVVGAAMVARLIYSTNELASGYLGTR